MTFHPSLPAIHGLHLPCRSTLQLVPGSLLFDMFRPERANLLPRIKGQVFLDYDPQHFSVVLKLLRELKMTQIGTVRPEVKLLRSEDSHHLVALLGHLGLADAFDMEGREEGLATPSTAPLEHQPALKGIGHHLMSIRSHLASSIVPSSLKLGSGDAPAAHSGGVSDSSPSKGSSSSSGSSSGSSSSGSSSSRFSRTKLTSSQRTPTAATAAATGGGTVPAGKRDAVKLAASPSLSRPASMSSLYYIQANYEAKRGIKISVYTEEDLNNLTVREPFDVVCDATTREGLLSFTFVSRQDFVSLLSLFPGNSNLHYQPVHTESDNMFYLNCLSSCLITPQDNVFLGITTRNHLDRKGSQVPCFGWMSKGRIYQGGCTMSKG